MAPPAAGAAGEDGRLGEAQAGADLGRRQVGAGQQGVRAFAAYAVEDLGEGQPLSRRPRWIARGWTAIARATSASAVGRLPSRSAAAWRTRQARPERSTGGAPAWPERSTGAAPAGPESTPAGSRSSAVGLNLGLQDAMNLGWKLAAVVRGSAGEDLLDTYHDERRRWAEDVAEHTLAQTALITATTPAGQALRRLLSDLIGMLPDLSLMLARRLAGLDVHYGKPGAPEGSRVAETGDALLHGQHAELVVDGRRAVVRPDGYIDRLAEG